MGKQNEAIEIIDKLLEALNAAWGKFPTWKERHDAWTQSKEAATKARVFKDNASKEETKEET